MDENSALTPEQIYEAYSPRIYNLCRRLLNNDADAQDVTQDISCKRCASCPNIAASQRC